MLDISETRKIQREFLLKCFIWITPLILLALFFLINIRHDVIFLFCFILTCLVICVPVSVYNDKFNTLIIKNNILPNLRKNFGKSISFDKNNDKNYIPDVLPLNRTWGAYFYRWKNINNVISGCVNGINYKIADTNTGVSFCGFSFSDFYGQIIELDNKNIFNDEIFIKPKKIYNKSFYNSYLLNKEFFIKGHVVYTKNNFEYDKFLFIKSFIEYYNKKKMYIHINKYKMLIMIESNNSLLNKFNLLNIKEYNYKNISMIFNLIKSLCEK